MRWLLTFPECVANAANYRRWLEAGGVEAVFIEKGFALPADTSAFDALLLPGGGDVDPERYGEERRPETGGVVAARDQLEADLIAEFRATHRPVFGICRGLQILNVACGGGLIQHVPDAVPDDAERHFIREGQDAGHLLRVEAETRLGQALASASEVNSSHHQAADPLRVGAGLRVVAWSREGVVEALESVDAGERISVVQWHPERMDAEAPASRGLREYWCRIASDGRGG